MMGNYLLYYVHVVNTKNKIQNENGACDNIKIVLIILIYIHYTAYIFSCDFFLKENKMATMLVK